MAVSEHQEFYLRGYWSLSLDLQCAGKIRHQRVGLFICSCSRDWFNVCVGRILTRFTGDISTLDLSLGVSLQSVNSSLASLCASLITIVFFSHWFIIPAVILGYVYFKVGSAYLWVSWVTTSLDRSQPSAQKYWTRSQKNGFCFKVSHYFKLLRIIGGNCELRIQPISILVAMTDCVSLIGDSPGFLRWTAVLQ